MQTHGRHGSVSVRVAAHPSLGVLYTFDGTVDDWANYDPSTHDYRVVLQDSFLSLTGYRRDFLPFEFVRRLAWHLGSRDGTFAGMVLLAGSTGMVPEYYEESNRVSKIPDRTGTHLSWQRLHKASAYFPRSIDDMLPIVNENNHDAVVYLGLSEGDGAITRLEEDDEWYVRGDATRIVPAMRAWSVASDCR